MPLTLEKLDRISTGYRERLVIEKDRIRFPSPAPARTSSHSSTSLWTVQYPALQRNYDNSTLFEQFAKTRGWISPYYIAALISKGSLKGKDLDILDVGCHHANLLTAIEEVGSNRIKIESYTGLDFSDSAVRTAQSRYPYHHFITGDALNRNSYIHIPNYSKNAIICSGVCDYLTPSKIKQLLENIEEKLSLDNDARIYLTYRTTRPKYSFDDAKERKLPHVTGRIFTEDGIKFYGFPDPHMKDLMLFNYNPDDIERIAEESGLEIVKENSLSCPSVNNVLGSDYDYICLKRKKSSLPEFTPCWDVRVRILAN